MTSPAVVFDEVFFFYGEDCIISNATFAIKEREFIGVIGPNGGGKTTLMRLMLGLIIPARGEVRIFGTAPGTAAPPVAYVPQHLQFDRLFPISLFELVLMGLLNELPWYGRFSQAHKRRAEEAMERMGIAHLRKRSVGTLSGGQLQRALIARALVTQPQLLLLDEPTANVDAAAEVEIRALLQALREEITIVMVTHDLNTSICEVDRVLCVQEEVSAYAVNEVCEHFALGLYHTPLIADPGSCCRLQVDNRQEELP